MQRTTPILLLVAVTALLAFGAFAMNMNMQGGVQGKSAVSCIAVAVRGVSCPENAGTIGFLSFHFNAWKDLAAARAGMFAAAAVLATLAAAFAASRAPRFGAAASRRASGLLMLSFAWQSRLRAREPDAFTPPFLQELTHWIALHEQSPSLALRHSR